MGTHMTRRGFLGLVGAGGAATATMSLAGWAPGAVAQTAPPRIGADPFTLGVASGDPRPQGVVLWTRLAPDPLALDGTGGMPARPFPVRWELAEDERFRRSVRRGTYVTTPELGHSVHVEVGGLRPGRQYFYRFRAGDAVSRIGRTRTTPATGDARTPLRFAFASCSMFEHGYFTAYRHMADEAPDLVVHLGDYIYEYAPNEYSVATGNVRQFANGHIHTLADYRVRHAQYKGDADLQEAHAVAPWIVTWDDHEIDNNWADEVPEVEDDQQTREEFLARRAVGMQAYWENMPLPHSLKPRGIDLPLYRRLAWGSLASFNVLDTRQYRSDQACGDGSDIDCAERLDPARTLTGAEQEAWLLDGLGRSPAAWNVLAQQVVFAQRDFEAGPVQRFSMDAWDGYKASRDRVLQGILERQPSHPVVLTGDVHVNYAADLKADFADPASDTFGVELVGTSITSGGNGSDTTTGGQTVLAENPHFKFFNSQRGYVSCTVDRDTWRADYRVLPYVNEPGAPVSTRASFVTERRNPGLQPA